MLEKIKNLLKEVQQFHSMDADEVEQFRINYLGRNGLITELFEDFRQIPNDQKRATGQALNELKNAALEKVNALKASIEDLKKTEKKEISDFSLPTGFIPMGSRHPVSLVRRDIIEIFNRLGFVIAEGPEIEDDWHNFTSLNFQSDHPARDMQDTFFIEYGNGKPEDQVMLRTHTTSVQIRVLEKKQPPIRIVMPGRVFRNEAISARAHVIFHQIDGVYIDTNVTFADLKQTLYYFATEYFGKQTQIRFRPSYFPFTEPSAEMDISCFICGGKGCNICKHSGWVEIMGCGMIDPNVLDYCKIDSEKYTGFAFGMGVERIALLKYQIKDLRLFFENDIRFLKQFEGVV